MGTVLERLKELYSVKESNEVLNAYLDLAAQKVINRAFPFRTDVTEVPERYTSNQLEIAVYLLNKRGAEGQVSHNENGVNRTYENASVPRSMLKDIIPSGEVVG